MRYHVGYVIRHRFQALLLAAALVALCGGDLFAARAGGCGPHACCAKGACAMMAKGGGGARLDRCASHDQQVPPVTLPEMAPDSVALPHAPAVAVAVIRLADGSAFDVDRPPRV